MHLKIMRNLQTFLFLFFFFVSTKSMAEQKSRDLFSCDTAQDCALHEEANCCMPWLTAVNRMKIANFEEQSMVDRKKYEATNCMCEWQALSSSEHHKCIEKIRSALKCLNGKCELPFKDLSSGLSFCKKTNG